MNFLDVIKKNKQKFDTIEGKLRDLEDLSIEAMRNETEKKRLEKNEHSINETSSGLCIAAVPEGEERAIFEEKTAKFSPKFDENYKFINPRSSTSSRTRKLHQGISIILNQ